MRLDRGAQPLRSAARRDEVEPSAGREPMLGQSEDAVGERVADAEVVEKPSVEFGLAQRLCDLFDSCDRGYLTRFLTLSDKEKARGTSERFRTLMPHFVRLRTSQTRLLGSQARLVSSRN